MPSHYTHVYINQFIKDLLRGQPDEFMKRLRSFFAAIPYDMEMGNERNFHNALYVFITLLGLKVKTEVKTSSGRID
ncbi:MAG: AAA family ATPase, partial [Muribaculaceae bacterium]|nr:AAA family ATPase [Muribaculaceae bacterium]